AQPPSEPRTRCEGGLEAAHFFFSSRRRHTSFSRDWSSDVCSSDLCRFQIRFIAVVITDNARHQRPWFDADRLVHDPPLLGVIERSEERRVGKECRCRGAPSHRKKNRSGTSAATRLVKRQTERCGAG